MWKLAVFLFLSLVRSGNSSGNCDAKNYQSIDNAPEDALIYGITQVIYNLNNLFSLLHCVFKLFFGFNNLVLK